MRRVVTILLVALLLCPDLPARDLHKWQNVEKLRHGTTVSVVLWNGGEIKGKFEFATDSSVQVAASNVDAYDPSSIQTIDRTSIRRVIRLRAAWYMPNERTWGTVGAVGGAGAGAIAAGVSYGDGLHAFFGGLAGALFGWLAGVLAGGVVMIAQIPGAYPRHPKVIFEAAHNPGPPGSTN